MRKSVLIYGAGAIGRGFLGPLFHKYDICLSFVEINQSLVNEMKNRKSYKAAITKKNDYEIVDVPIEKCFLLGEEYDIERYDIVFCCVGPNNCYDLAGRLKKARTVISCENDEAIVPKLRELSGNSNIYFGIPDVITSNTAPPELLEKDPLMTVTEQGILVLEKGSYQLPKKILQVEKEELNMHWLCKLFIHNAPHAIVAYLGWLKGYKYIHEAMGDPDIENIVVGSIHEITDGVIAAGYATKDFAEVYKEKELNRFRNQLLFDTIVRVAREPLRKMAKDNRIILGMRIAQFNRTMPEFTAIGAKAALAYDNPDDHEAEYLQTLRKSVGDEEVLKRYSGVELFDPLNCYIVERDISKFISRKTKNAK